MGSAEEPLIRTIPIPLSPNGVEMAAIVSSSFDGVLLEELDEEPLFTLIQVVSGPYPSFFIGIILTFFNSPSPRLSVLREGSSLRVM